MSERKKPANTPASSPDLDRVLPSSPESERYILGSILADPESWAALDASGLEPGDFHTEAHRRVLGAMAGLRGQESVVDRVTVTEELMRRGHLESVGGMSYLLDLTKDLPDPPSPAAYCAIVKEKSALRKIIQTGHEMMNRALLGQDTSEEILTSAHERVQDLAGSGPQKDGGGRSPERIVLEYPGGLSAFLDPNLRRKGLSTGYRRWDDMTSGLHPGELMILGARPSAGKSALLLNVLEFLSMSPKQQRPVAIFSLEMSADSLVTRLLCSKSRVDAHKFRAGYLNDAERKKLQDALYRITQAPLRIYDKFGITMPEIVREIRRLVRDEGIQLVGIDYLQLIAAKYKGENRNLEVSEMTRQLKIVAGECEIPVICLSQLNRSNEKRTGKQREPILSDLRESGAIEQDADVVAFIHRQEMYEKDREDIKGQASLIISKQRHGPTGTIPLRWLGHITRFVPRTEPGDPEEENENA